MCVILTTGRRIHKIQDNHNDDDDDDDNNSLKDGYSDNHRRGGHGHLWRHASPFGSLIAFRKATERIEPTPRVTSRVLNKLPQLRQNN